MSDGTAKSESAAASRRGVPRGSLADAEKIAAGLWKAARLGSVAPEALAKELSGEEAKASGGAWRNKMALVNVFGLVQKDGNKLKLSRVGQGIVREDDHAKRAESRRSAVLGVNPYKEILSRSAGHELPSTAGIASTFEYEYGLPKADAKKAAESFVASVKLASFVTDANLVTMAEVTESAAEDLSGRNGDAIDEPATGSEPIVNPLVPGPSVTDPVVQAHRTVKRIGPSVSVTVSVDLSAFAANDVIRILAVLGAADDDNKGD
ncbi:MAG: hypothetical protein AB7Q42_09685 [Acidimicrobiia bacterium]